MNYDSCPNIWRKKLSKVYHISYENQLYILENVCDFPPLLRSKNACKKQFFSTENFLVFLNQKHKKKDHVQSLILEVVFT